MNINPISFGRTLKTTAPANVVSRAVDLINCPESATLNEAYAQQRLQKAFYDTTMTGEAKSVSFNNGKTSFIVSGKESEELSKLRIDMVHRIAIAQDTYGEDSQIVDLVAQCEEDRFVDLAKDVVYSSLDGEIELETNKKGEIKSVNLII
ncbi:MAG: hypothetical protein IJB79_03000 [Candidatus Gastranaerophilales bacterium]|nr:hypothetical protein [Candidatus Gastranaerophilales bacterium]